jgi:hypothetical protein
VPTTTPGAAVAEEREHGGEVAVGLGVGSGAGRRHLLRTGVPALALFDDETGDLGAERDEVLERGHEPEPVVALAVTAHDGRLVTTPEDVAPHEAAPGRAVTGRAVTAWATVSLLPFAVRWRPSG